MSELIFGLSEFFIESEYLFLVMDFEPLYFVTFLLQFFPQVFGLSVLPILEFLSVLPLGVKQVLKLLVVKGEGIIFLLQGLILGDNGHECLVVLLLHVDLADKFFVGVFEQTQFELICGVVGILAHFS